MNPGMAVMPLASMVLPLAADGAPGATETIFPARTTIDPRSITRAIGERNDTRIGDREVLRKEGRKRSQSQAGQYYQGVSFHANSLSDDARMTRWAAFGATAVINFMVRPDRLELPTFWFVASALSLTP